MSKYYPIFLILLLDIIFLFFTYDDYGIGWDEASSRDIGVHNAMMANHHLGDILYNKDALDVRIKTKIEVKKQEKYLNQAEVEQYIYRMYGPAFELLLVGIERVFDIQGNRNLYLFRHITTHLFYLLGLFFFYLLIYQHFKKTSIATLSTFMLLLIPRLYPHTFYNPKDIPFLVTCIIAAYTLFRFLDNKNYKNAILHALACAWAVDTRIVGILFPALTFSLFAIEWFLAIRKKDGVHRNFFVSTAIFSGFLAVFIIFFWPYLWKVPVEHFLWSLKSMSKYPWDGQILFLGEMFTPMIHLPSFYLPYWFVITTPLFFLFLFLMSFLSFPAIKLAHLSSKHPQKRLFLVSLFLFIIPWTMAIILQSVVYDDGRHFFFIYPFFIIICIFGWQNVKKIWAKYNYLSLQYYYGITALFILPLLFKMFTLHPFQYIYFNVLAPHNIEKELELDYYGISHKNGLDFLLKNATKPINIMRGDSLLEPAFNNSFLLTEKELSRIHYVENITEANYFLTTYRATKDRNAYLNYWKIKPEWEIHRIEVDGNVILSVFELANEKASNN